METAEQKLTGKILKDVNYLLKQYIDKPNTEEIRADIKMKVWELIVDKYRTDAGKYKVNVAGVNNFDKKDGWRWQRSFHEVNINVTHHDAPVWYTTKDYPPTLMHVIVTARGLALSKDWEDKIDDRFTNAMKGV